MRPTRHSVLVAGAALGALALTGCSLLPGTDDSTPPASPTRHHTHAVSTPKASQQTATATAPASPSASATPTEPPATASGGSDSTVAATRYSDKTSLLQLPVSDQALPQAPAGLVDFAREQLKQMWHDQFQDDPGCMGIAQIRIRRTLPTSAYVEASWGDLTPTCPQYAGNPGSWAVWGSDGHGTWSVRLTGEGTAACSDLVAAAVPRAIYPTCSDGTKKVPNPVG